MKSEYAKSKKIYRSIQPFAEDRRTIYSKLYFERDWFDELEEIIPEALKDSIYNEEGEINFETIVNQIEQNLSCLRDSAVTSIELNFSLINEGVVNLDSVFLGELKDGLIEEYKPYFYEFSGYCETWNDLLQFLKYYINRKEDYFSCYLEFSDELGKYDEEIIATISGSVLFSASPIEQKSGKLVIVDSLLLPNPKFKDVLDDKVYKCNTKPFKKRDRSIVESKVNRVIGSACDPIDVKVYNVGQASTISVELSNQKFIYFDIGVSKNETERKLSYTKRAIVEYKKNIPDMIVLSHWDIDHILGVANCNPGIYNSLWLVPNLWCLKRYKANFISDSAKRLLKYIDFINPHKLLIIDHTWKSSCLYRSHHRKLAIWSGDRKYSSGKNSKGKRYQITPTNNFGIIMSLHNSSSMLLSGDCDYKKMPSDIWSDNYEYVVASHHCSKMSRIPLMRNSRHNRAIVSIGLFNSYGHPNNAHLQDLIDIGYDIVTTFGRIYIRCKLS